MTPDLSRAAARTIQDLTAEARPAFVEAVTAADDVRDVREPYRSWLRDIDAVPDRLRASRQLLR